MNHNQQYPIVQQQHYFSFSYRKKNRRQADSLLSVALILISVGCILFEILYVGTSDIGSESYGVTFLTLFFVGNIIGTIIGGFVANKFNKKLIYYGCGVLTLISGALKLAKGRIKTTDELDTYLDIQLASNFIAGIPFGICLLTSIIHGGEISVRHLRGAVVHQTQSYIDCGVFLAILIVAVIINIMKRDYFSVTMYPVEAIGLTMVLASILSFITTFFLVIESPEFLIKNNNESEARTNLIKLRKEGMETLEIIRDLEEIKQTLRESDMKSSDFIGSFIQVDDIIPLVKLFFLRFAYLMGTGLPLNRIMYIFTFTFIGNDHAGLIFIALKLIGSIICTFAVDRFGRKTMLQISLGLCGLIAIIFNATYMSERDSVGFVPSNVRNALGALALLYQLLLGLGAGIPYVYMSESFEFSRKIYLNAIIFIAESLIQIIIMVTIDLESTYADGYILFTGILQILVTAAILKFLPETSCKSLRESKELMEKSY